MRRCYRGAALVMSGVLMTGLASFDSCSIGALTVYAAEDANPEELTSAFQEEVRTEEENVDTETPEEEAAMQPTEEPSPEVPAETPAPEEAVIAEPEPEPTQAAAECFQLEEQEYQILLKIVEAEAGGEDTTGKILVANVIMNRVRNGHFPDSVYGVVYDRSGGSVQFSPTADGRIDQVSVSPDTVEAVARALGGEDISAGALYFRSVTSTNGWFDRNLNRVMEHGNHIFYAL